MKPTSPIRPRSWTKSTKAKRQPFRKASQGLTYLPMWLASFSSSHSPRRFAQR
uniref:Uncharacterized protein n=1 Tax=Hyaloperonospora arabidopsidis (strain Emoy2) TaxID=559515 RepID=M4BLC8_HYAAE